MNAEVISIGTELLMGEITDTNASFIASRLPPLGIRLQRVSQLGDDLDVLSEAFSRGLDRSDIIFTTGGLGPTKDDLTREAIAGSLGQEMVVQDDLLQHLKGYFRNRGWEMPATNIKQATLIPSASSIPNRRGTAPGWWVEQDGKIIVSMPGPPSELHDIWDEEVVPRLRRKVRGEVILTRTIKTTGLSEGGLDEMVSQYLGGENPYLGIYAKSDGIHLRIIARAANDEAAGRLIEPMERGLVSIVGPYVWGYDDVTPEQEAVGLLAGKALTLATMESGTGGLLANTISDVPGSDGCFRGGFVCHDARSAVAGGVPAAVVGTRGLVSEEAVVAMARVAVERLEADIGIGLSGVVGPEEIEGKPVGRVHTAIVMGDSTLHFSSELPPRRQIVKSRAVANALIELRRLLNSL